MTTERSESGGRQEERDGATAPEAVPPGPATPPSPPAPPPAPERVAARPREDGTATPDAAPAIRIERLTKVYEDDRRGERIVALRSLDLQIPRGQVYGLIGPNGAGKSTLMRIIATLLEPTFGRVEVCGHDTWSDREAACRELGFMPELFHLYEELTVEEYLEFFAGAYGVPRAQRRRTIEDVIELTDLGVRRRSLSGSLSKGMRQRLLLAKTMIHDPAVLILDEPTSGMDPQARIEFRNIVRTLARLGKTVVISSHILPDLSTICSAFGIMERGTMRVSGTFAEVTRTLRMTARVEVGFIGGPKRVSGLIDGLPGAIAPKLGERTLEFGFEGDDEALAAILRRLVEGGVPVTRYVRRECDLEEIFLQIGADKVQ